MTEPLVQLDGIDFHYDPERPVLRQCSLTLSPGDRVGLSGPNGSGKTTLLHLIVGLARPQAGRVVAFGRPRTEEADFHDVRRRVGLLFQESDDQLFCPTVLADVAFGPLNLGRPRDEAREIARDTLSRLGLAGFEDRVTHRLSGGEKRLVALAGVLAMEPEVLLLDEPCAGLADDAAANLAGLLAGLPQAMLVVTHDAGLLARTTTRRLRLAEGRLWDARG
ncbi:MAG: ABC transporter ATP-binding protein [Pirellulales bacterium]|nr:ABC transporter ATP-binding protein [Pirellulales bacterium]